MSPQPNILFLMSDEHRADVTGYEGNSVVRTPVLDELAASGAVFNNAYAPSPICIPGRQCMMSGQLPLTAGCLQFGQDLPPNSMTFARRLAQAGYATVAAGKLHHMGTDQMQGWTQRIGSEMHVSPWFIPDQDKPLDRGAMAKFMQFKWSDAKEVKRAGIGRGPCIAHDEYALTGALDFIDAYFNSPYYDRPRAAQPLLLKVSFLQPHYPYFTDEERFNYYLNRVDPYLDQEVSDHPFLSQHRVRPGEDASERELRRATAAYYGMVETIDGYYGQVLDRLRHVGQDLDDWIIIYTSDHGEMLGQHGIWEKQKFYEASARVPLIIRWPKSFGEGKQIEENVNLCDLFATLCDLCEISTPDGLDSRSLESLLRGDNSKWDNETVSQFGQTNLMIKRDALKYQYYGSDMPEVLFDLERDPDELINFIDDPRYVSALTDLRRRRAQLGHGPDAVSDYVNAGYAPRPTT